MGALGKAAKLGPTKVFAESCTGWTQITPLWMQKYPPCMHIYLRAFTHIFPTHVPMCVLVPSLGFPRSLRSLKLIIGCTHNVQPRACVAQASKASKGGTMRHGYMCMHGGMCTYMGDICAYIGKPVSRSKHSKKALAAFCANPRRP